MFVLWVLWVVTMTGSILGVIWIYIQPTPPEPGTPYTWYEEMCANRTFDQCLAQNTIPPGSIIFPTYHYVVCGQWGNTKRADLSFQCSLVDCRNLIASGEENEREKMVVYWNAKENTTIWSNVTLNMPSKQTCQTKLDEESNFLLFYDFFVESYFMCIIVGLILCTMPWWQSCKQFPMEQRYSVVDDSDTIALTVPTEDSSDSDDE